jgi:hypothetical protein
MIRRAGENIDGFLRQLAPRVLPDDHPVFQSPRAADLPHAVANTENPLLSSGFTAVPRKLDDLAIRLAGNGRTRSIAQVFSLVVLDIARYTDGQHLDVIISNGGLRSRRAVGGASVKAVIHLLVEWGVLDRRRPSAERLAELNGRMPWFGGQRRYLVWNKQEKWNLPETDGQLAAVAEFWKRYTGKGGAKEKEVRASTKGTPEYVRPRTTIYTPVPQDYKKNDPDDPGVMGKS